MSKQGFTKFEMVLGLAVVAIVAVVLFPPLRSGVDEDRSIRAWSRAESIAYAILDYHDETGGWPPIQRGSMELGCLTQQKRIHDPAGRPAMAMMGASGLGASTEFQQPEAEPWLDEVPLDAWNRPYTVQLIEIPGGQGALALIVLSAGPDGVLETDPAQWPLECLTGVAPRDAIDPDDPDDPNDTVQAQLTVGDDLACMMTLDGQRGGS